MFLFREKGFYYSHSYQQRTTTGRLIDNKRNIFAEERPISESVNGDAQLRRPSPKTASRYDFEKYISNYQGDFERAMGRVINMNRYRENRQRIKRNTPTIYS